MPIKIQQVLVSDLALPDTIITDSKYAYDITTDMADGSFEYELTLPKAKDSEAEISFIEKTIDEAKREVKDVEVKLVEETSELTVEQVITEENVKISGLDHFTIFIATYSDNSLNVEKSTYLRC